MKAAEEHLLIFEGANDGRYPHRSRPSKQRHNDERRGPRRSLRSSPKDVTVGRRRGKNRQMASALRVAEITGQRLCRLGTLLARPLLRIRYGFPQRPICDLISGSQGKIFNPASRKAWLYPSISRCLRDWTAWHGSSCPSLDVLSVAGWTVVQFTQAVLSHLALPRFDL